MNTSIQIQDHFRDATKMMESESYEALATALGHAMLKFLTFKINALLALCALVCLLAWLATEQHTTVAVCAIVAWVFHLSVMLCISIAKGGDQL